MIELLNFSIRNYPDMQLLRKTIGYEYFFNDSESYWNKNRDARLKNINKTSSNLDREELANILHRWGKN